MFPEDDQFSGFGIPFKVKKHKNNKSNLASFDWMKRGESSTQSRFEGSKIDFLFTTNHRSTKLLSDKSFLSRWCFKCQDTAPAHMTPINISVE